MYKDITFFPDSRMASAKQTFADGQINVAAQCDGTYNYYDQTDDSTGGEIEGQHNRRC